MLQKLARVHRDDVFAVKPVRPKQLADAKAGDKPVATEKLKPKTNASTQAAKWFFAIIGMAIAVITLLGLWMALAYSRRQKPAIWALLMAGAAIPVIILAL